MEQFAKETLPVSLEEEMRRSYLDYAMSVIVGRALPDVRDGLKPVHRRVLFAMQEARRLRPHGASAYISLLTAAWGLGQIAGPPLVALLLRRSATPGEGFALSLEIAAGALLGGAALFAWLVRRYPLAPDLNRTVRAATGPA